MQLVGQIDSSSSRARNPALHRCNNVWICVWTSNQTMTHAADQWTGAWPKSGTRQHQAGFDICHFQLRRRSVPPWHILRRYAWFPTSFRLSQNEMHTSGWQWAREAFYSKKQQQQAFLLLPLCPWSTLGATGTRLPGWSGWQPARKASKNNEMAGMEIANCNLNSTNERNEDKTIFFMCVKWSMKCIRLTTVLYIFTFWTNNNDARPCFYLIKSI